MKGPVDLAGYLILFLPPLLRNLKLLTFIARYSFYGESRASYISYNRYFFALSLSVLVIVIFLYCCFIIFNGKFCGRIFITGKIALKVDISLQPCNIFSE